MQNPKTTIAGYGVILIAAIWLIGRIYQGTPASMEDLIAICGLISGAGLVLAKDGGH